MYGFIRKCKCVLIFIGSSIFCIVLSVSIYPIVFIFAEEDSTKKIVVG